MTLDHSKAWQIAQEWLDAKYVVPLQVDLIHTHPRHPGEFLCLFEAMNGWFGAIVASDGETERVTRTQGPMPTQALHLELFDTGSATWTRGATT